MNKCLWVFWVLVCSLSAAQVSAQQSWKNQTSPGKEVAQNDSFVVVAGMRIGMPHPTGFEPATGYPGWMHASGASIMISTLPAPVSDMINGFTDEQLLVQGIVVEKRTEHPVQGLDGLWLTGTQEANGLSYHKAILIFGSQDETHMVVGQTPQGQEANWRTILASLQAAELVEQAETDPLDAAPFAIEWQNSPFQFAQAFGPSLLFSRDGLLPTQSPDEAVFIMSNLLVPMEEATRVLGMQQIIAQLPDLSVSGSPDLTEVEIAGFPGYQTTFLALNTESE